MKKILHLVVMVLTLGFAFASCSDDEDTNPKVGTNPEMAAAGTYVGTFTRILNEDSVYSSGKIVITPTESAYVANFEFTSDEVIWDNDQLISNANITFANDGFKFVNSSKANGMGTEFSGTIDGSGNIASYFQLSVKDGRVSNDYNYYFEGKKQ